ncbi:MAG: hypothetical protein NDJ89_16790 [Oligoflexia bacterium]|nr:hypothetical protein [Oligoflexia bacterium]
MRLHHLIVSAIVSIAAIASFQANAITRVGNSRFGSDDQGFSSRIAPEFCRNGFCSTRLTLEGSLILEDHALLIPMASGIFLPARAVVADFAAKYPSWVSLSREEIRNRLANGPWVKLVHSDPCVEAWLVSQDGTIATVATWGGGKGVVMVAPGAEPLLRAIESMNRDIELIPGACAWK